MTNRELIRHEFIMTADAIPIPIIQKKRKWLSRVKIRIHVCTHCENIFYGDMRGGECRNCYGYRLRTGTDRPVEFFQVSTYCNNQNCQQLLSEDKHALRLTCNACYIYKKRHGVVRPLKLCKKYKG